MGRRLGWFPYGYDGSPPQENVIKHQKISKDFWHAKYQNVKLPAFFGTSAGQRALTRAFLAYQMPYETVTFGGYNGRSEREPAFAITGNRSSMQAMS
jgi:hypothetical protein